jgi:hypothetical protein
MLLPGACTASLKACIQPVRLRAWDPECLAAEVPKRIYYQKALFNSTSGSLKSHDTCENTIRSSESMKGDVASLVADAIYADMEVFDVVILHNGMVASQDIPQGIFRPEDTLQLLPYNNELVILRLSGQDMLYAIEQGIHRALKKGELGAIPKTSGIRYTIDYSQPKGRRIIDVEVLGHFCKFQPLREDKIYTILTNSYLARGGDGYTIFTTSPTFTPTGVSEADSFWLHAQSTCILQFPWKRQMDADMKAKDEEKMLYKIGVPLKEMLNMNSTIDYTAAKSS